MRSSKDAYALFWITGTAEGAAGTGNGGAGMLILTAPFTPPVSGKERNDG